MKKTILFLLSALMLIAISACSEVNYKAEGPILQEDEIIVSHENQPEIVEVKIPDLEPQVLQNPFVLTGMPVPFEYEGGDEHADFYQYCVFKFDVLSIIGEVFIEYFGDREFLRKWDEFNYYLNRSFVTDLMEYPNLFVIIIENDIPDEIILAAIEANNNFYDKLTENYENKDEIRALMNFTDEDIAVVLTRDKEKVLAHFASEYSIVIGDKVYTPAWLYRSTPEDYARAGITPEMISERLELFAEFNFTDEAAEAFEEKLSEFMEQDVNLNRMAS